MIQKNTIRPSLEYDKIVDISMISDRTYLISRRKSSVAQRAAAGNWLLSAIQALQEVLSYRTYWNPYNSCFITVQYSLKFNGLFSLPVKG